MNELTRRTEHKPKWGLFGDDLDNIFEGFLRPLAGFEKTENGAMIPAVDVVDEESR